MPQALNTVPMETDARQVLDIALRTTSVETGTAVECTKYYKDKWIEVKRCLDEAKQHYQTQLAQSEARHKATFNQEITCLERFYEVQMADLCDHNHDIMIEGQMIDQILVFEKQLKNMSTEKEWFAAEKERLVTQVEEMQAASEDQLRSHKKAVSDKSNELLAMWAKQPQPTSLGQVSAEPEFSQNRWFINQGKRASHYQVIKNSSTRIPVIPLHPVPLPITTIVESEGAVRPLDGGENQSSIENAIVEALKNLGVFRTTSTGNKTKKHLTQKQATIKFQQSSLTKDEDRQIKQLLRQMMRQTYNTKTADDFILYMPVPAEDVALCNGGIWGPAIDEYRLDFSEGYRSSKWNEIVIGKLVAKVLAVLECLDLPSVSEEYLEGEIHRQVIRARNAWALHQPHFMKESNQMEMQEEAHARANGFRNKHGESVLHQTQKQCKFDKHEKTITEVVELKGLTVVADLATWKHLSKILCYLGMEGCHPRRKTTLQLGKLSSEQIADYMWIVDKAAEHMRINKGANPAPRCVTGLEGKAQDLKGLPECMYNPEWLVKQKESRPLYYDSLKVSKKAFSLLITATSRMEID
ncbi:hypothetical protein B0H10DRAFT_1941426 [Mycena sp. CBHHK59/15]|nr:hypothetical protein B0H10DRAFT_1941426 [Mycena sp. CBHHK59/15]